jgi:hypothetical protein
MPEWIETHIENSEAMVHGAMIRLMLKRLESLVYKSALTRHLGDITLFVETLTVHERLGDFLAGFGFHAHTSSKLLRIFTGTSSKMHRPIVLSQSLASTPGIWPQVPPLPRMPAVG